MNFLRGLLLSFLLVTAAHAQNPGTVTNHAFAIGKGPNVAGYKSLLCASGSFPVGQVGADPICRSLSGDVTMAPTGIVTLGTVNANVGSFGSTTSCPSFTVNAKGLVTAASQANCAPAVANLTGLGAGVATGLALGVNTSGGMVSPTPTRNGDVIYWNSGTARWTAFPGNNSGTQFLQEDASGVPSWATVAGTGTVTSVICGTGLDGGTITSSGTCSLSAARRTLPTTQPFLSGSGTYTTPANVLWIEVKMVGGGGGGAGSGTAGSPGGAGSAGGNTTFGTFTAGLGSGAASFAGGAGGTNSGSPTQSFVGGAGGSNYNLQVNQTGAAGGNSSFYSGGGAARTSAGVAGATNSGGGGSGASGSSINSTTAGGGGGAGGSVYTVINSPAATYSYGVGAGGTGGTAGTSGDVGGAGGSGSILVIEHYGS